ncbi:hypothetical protein HDU80_004654 [Chytriomyces hyalinus]|nr:hypothetical protein HDU80_004654 [Chytriomyces hyalinus]
MAASLVSGVYASLTDSWSSLCLDSNLVYTGAQLTVKPCSAISPTQVFRLIWTDKDTPRAKVQVSINAAVPLCATVGVTTDGVASGILSMQPCSNATKGIQTFSAAPYDTSEYIFQAQPDKCITISSFNTFKFAAVGSCWNEPSFKVGSSLPAPIVALPENVQPIKIVTAGTNWTGCIDGTNPTALTNVTCVPNNPNQLWFQQFGQVRHIATGLCLDSIGVSARLVDQTNVVKLTACNSVLSQLWILEPGTGVIRNGVNYNCIRIGMGKVYLGSNLCGSTDQMKNFGKVFSHTLVPQPPSAKCTTEVIRKDFRDLTAEEQRSYFLALNILKASPSMMGYGSKYHDYVRAHATGGVWYHSTPMFLPWHRAFLRQFELECQKVLQNSTFALPYWAWGADSNSWFLESTGILNSTVFGTTGAAGDAAGCVTDGLVGNWTSSLGTCINRYFDPEGLNGDAVYDEVTMLGILHTNPFTDADYTNYNDFVQYLGIPHGIFHMLVSGASDAGTYGTIGMIGHSPDDPVFFLHHGNLDRYWKYWQKLNPTLGTAYIGINAAYDGTMSFPPGYKVSTKVTLKDTLVTFNYPVGYAVVYGSGIMCYTEQPYSLSLDSIQEFSTLTKRDPKVSSAYNSKTKAQTKSTAKSTSVYNANKLSSQSSKPKTVKKEEKKEDKNEDKKDVKKGDKKGEKKDAEKGDKKKKPKVKKPLIPKGTKSNTKARKRPAQKHGKTAKMVAKMSANMLMDHKAAKAVESVLLGFGEAVWGEVGSGLKTIYNKTLDSATMEEQAAALLDALTNLEFNSAAVKVTSDTL